MKTSLNSKTLAYQLGIRPGVIARDRSDVSLKDTVTALNAFMAGETDLIAASSPSQDTKVMGHPEQDALVFYLLNHAVSIVRQRKHPYEDLGPYAVLVDEYHNVLAHRGARMFFYLLLICTRESRHEKNPVAGPFWDHMAAMYGEEVRAFFKVIRGGGSDGAADALRKNPPDVPLGVFTASLVESFNKGKYGSAFGGKAWGKVAAVLNDVVHGKISVEMMLDTAFTLVHNGGPIFNKGMLFENYSAHLYKILDVQRSGQIPQLIGNNETKWVAKSQELKEFYSLAYANLPEEMDGHVDWYLVEELGAVHTYPSEKQDQANKYGPPSKFKEKMAAQQAAKVAAEKAAEDELKNSVEILPGMYVKKVQPVRG